jgi:hypothetical protein
MKKGGPALMILNFFSMLTGCIAVISFALTAFVFEWDYLGIPVTFAGAEIGFIACLIMRQTHGTVV